MRHRIPPLPIFTVLIDREDGTEWVLGHKEFDGLLYVSINDEGLLRGRLPPRTDYTRYAYLDMGQGVRLFVRDGRIGYEMIEYEANDHAAQTRVGVSKESHKLVIPTVNEPWSAFPDELGWIEENTFD